MSLNKDIIIRIEELLDSKTVSAVVLSENDEKKADDCKNKIDEYKNEIGSSDNINEIIDWFINHSNYYDLLPYLGIIMIKNHQLDPFEICKEISENKTIPSPNDDFDEALEIFYGLSKPEYEASVLLGGLFEWICIEELDLDFKQLCEICKVFKNITCQTWQMNVDEEISLFSNYYAFQTGYSVPISHDKSIKEVTEELTAIDKKIDFSNMLFNQYSFAPIAIIASRYYNNPVLPQFWRQFDKWNT